jgi:photosystem II stability/assembly factor-like uncharacterized protein
MSLRAEVYLCAVGQSKKFAEGKDNLFGETGNVVRMRRMRKPLLTLLLMVFASGVAAATSVWVVQTSGISTNLRGVSVARFAVPSGTPVVWASGSNGVILRSDDRGTNWKRLHVDGADSLDFRGIFAIDEKTAYTMSSGEGEKSRIYKTLDGGETWEMQYTDKRPAFFLDDIVCFTESYCFALGDPINGKFLILATEDGKNWHELPRDNMPEIIPGEGAFAASGTSLVTYGAHDIYFGTGGGATARVFYSLNRGKTWTVSDTPLAAGNASSGVFSVVRVRDTVIAVGGDYRVASGTSGVAAYSTDSGATWKLSSTQPGGYRSGVASVDDKMLVSVGPNGGDVSYDMGATWTPTSAINLNAVTVSIEKKVWAVGAKGTVASLLDSNAAVKPKN